jgi:Tfp pilus assembly ATPase PilU
MRRGNVAMVLHVIPDTIPNFEDLHLPATLKQVSLEAGVSCSL